MKIVMLGIDLGKNVCSLASLDETGAVVLRRRMKRASVLLFTAQQENRTWSGLACRFRLELDSFMDSMHFSGQEQGQRQ